MRTVKILAVSAALTLGPALPVPAQTVPNGMGTVITDAGIFHADLPGSYVVAAVSLEDPSAFAVATVGVSRPSPATRVTAPASLFGAWDPSLPMTEGLSQLGLATT
jgi:hypothetical protein